MGTGLGMLREAAIRARSVTGIRHVLPDFLIIGIRKGGTTSLHRYLRQHPQARGPTRKEPRFFYMHWARGLAYYRTFFPLAAERRLSEREGRPFLVFESTPNYLYWPEVPERVAQVLPDVRCVALLRNPIDRAFSDHQAFLRTGRDTRSFDEAVATELAQHQRGDRVTRPYEHGDLGSKDRLLAFGLYADALERWWSHVPPERLLVLISEEFFADERATVQRVTEFVGLPPHDGYDITAGNQGGYVARPSPATRERLQEFYAPYNQRLYSLLGRDLGWR